MSVTAPITTSVDELLRLRLLDLRRRRPRSLATYSHALGLEEIAQVVRTDDDGNDGWSAFADPERCPDDFLLTLALWSGIRYPRRMSTADLRLLIGPQAPGLWRGTVDAISAAVRRYLIPGGQIFFEERADGDPYLLRIFTYEYQTLDEDAPAPRVTNADSAGNPRLRASGRAGVVHAARPRR